MVKYDDGDEEIIKAKTQYEMVKSMEEVRLTGLKTKIGNFVSVLLGAAATAL